MKRSLLILSGFILLCSLGIQFSHAGEKKAKKGTVASRKLASTPLQQMNAHVYWHNNITHIQVDLGTRPKIVFKNSYGDQRSKTLKAKDVRFLLSQFSKVPPSKASSNCPSIRISFDVIPNDGLKRSVCVKSQPKTSKKYLNLINLLEFASR